LPPPAAGAGSGAAGFNVGADYNLGGPHTLGDMAAVEWAPNFITASAETLAASHTKMQLRAPRSRLGRPAAASTSGAAAGVGRCVAVRWHGVGVAAGTWVLGVSGIRGLEAPACLLGICCAALLLVTAGALQLAQRQGSGRGAG
jgi:hypothetical protein